MVDLEKTIVHDLAGSMTSITGLAEIVALRPDLPSRESLIQTLAGEAKVATQTVRDLQVVRALAADAVVESIREVASSEWFGAIKDELSADVAGTLAPPPSDLPSVRADLPTLAELVARLLSSLGSNAPVSPPFIAYASGDEVIFEIETNAPTEEIEEGRISGRKHLRPLALADLLLPRWDGRLEIAAAGDHGKVRFVLQAVV